MVVLAAGGAALGYWSAAGEGDDSVDTATAQMIILGPGTPAADLYPGGAGDVAVEISNATSAAVHVRGLALDTSQGSAGFQVDVGHPACPPTVLSFLPQTNDGQGWTVPAASGGADGVVSLHLAGALTMDVGAPDGCQGGHFTVYLMASP